MKADFSKAFNVIKSYLTERVPELGEVITRWEDPFQVHKNRTIMLPDGHTGTDSQITFSVVLWVSLAEKTADAVTQTQLTVMEKIFNAVYGKAPYPVMKMAVNAADYFDPPPQSPVTGLLRVTVNTVLDYLDDCG